jgi:hypothetical protein
MLSGVQEGQASKAGNVPGLRQTNSRGRHHRAMPVMRNNPALAQKEGQWRNR